jgi:hypothetical protein
METPARHAAHAADRISPAFALFPLINFDYLGARRVRRMRIPRCGQDLLWRETGVLNRFASALSIAVFNCDQRHFAQASSAP